MARARGGTLARVGLTDRRDEAVEMLSGGLARRVELAKGLLHGPELPLPR
jgi:ABC-2 type transport system ATP-binding protein